MKKLLAIAILCASTAAVAQPRPYLHGHWERHNNSWVWVLPALVTGVVGYEIGRNQQVIVQQPQTFVPASPAVTCTEWREVMQQDGTIAKERTCYQR